VELGEVQVSLMEREGEWWRELGGELPDALTGA